MKITMELLKDALTVFVSIIAIIVLVIVMWHFARSLNYEYSYEDMVRQTVIEMIDGECIKEHKQ